MHADTDQLLEIDQSGTKRPVIYLHPLKSLAEA